MSRNLLVLGVLAALGSPAGAVVLLDNTQGLTRATLSNGNQTTWGSNSVAYNRINGYTFQVGATSYDLTSVTIPLRWSGSGTITPNVRIQLWELPDLSSTKPAGGAIPFYTLNVSTNTFDSTYQYFTYNLTGSTVNVKQNTRYSIGFLTDQTSSSSSFVWSGYNPVAPNPSGSYNLTSLAGASGFFSTNGGSSFSSSNMTYGFQLTGAVTSAPEATTPILSAFLGAAIVFRRSRKRI